MADEKSKSVPLDLHVMVFAGPNGSGKTSLIDQIRETGLETLDGVYALPAYFINPDQIAKTFGVNFVTSTPATKQRKVQRSDYVP